MEAALHGQIEVVKVLLPILNIRSLDFRSLDTLDEASDRCDLVLCAIERHHLPILQLLVERTLRL